MRKYILSSTAFHFAILFLVLFSPLFRPKGPIMIIDGFDYVGSGGGGNGRAAGGPKAEHIGQVVPQPVKIPIPEKPAPVQKAMKTEEAWAIKNPKTEKVIETKKIEPEVERGESNQTEKTNIIRRGVDSNTVAGDGSYDFGTDGGTGKGIGIGFGPGEGGGFGGFGSYLKLLRQRIWGEWTQSAVFGSQRVCVIGLTVSRSGEVSDIRVEKPSGDTFYDGVAMRAVRNSSPLPPLPAGFPTSEQRFRIQFRLLE